MFYYHANTQDQLWNWVVRIGEKSLWNDVWFWLHSFRVWKFLYIPNGIIGGIHLSWGKIYQQNGKLIFCIFEESKDELQAYCCMVSQRFYRRSKIELNFEDYKEVQL